MVHNFSELLINVAYDLNKNNATLELNFMEMGEFIDKYLIIHFYQFHRPTVHGLAWHQIQTCFAH